MPACRQCRKLVNNTCVAHAQARELLGRPMPPPPLGACFMPIVEDYLKLIQPGMRVLDVGCGTWDWIRRRCEEVGAQFEGIDVNTHYYDKPVIATRIENLSDLSFEDESFDLVIGNQSLHLWPEFGCPLWWGLHQCFRVTRMGGRVCFNSPIHYQGCRPFMLGEMDRIRALFAPHSDQVQIEHWGEPCDPLPVFVPHPGYWALRGKRPQHLDIQAIKTRQTPPGLTTPPASRGQWARLKHYAPSYTVFRVLRKLGFFPKGGGGGGS